MEILHSKIYGEERTEMPLLVFHGLFGMLDNWGSFGKEFGELMPTHILDLRNHGRSFHSDSMTHDDLARDHIRYMVGGVSPAAQDERLLSFTFPERPGALMKFLNAMRPGWNISLFHYRNHGADHGRVLVGLEVPPKDEAEFANLCASLPQKPFYELGSTAAKKRFVAAADTS